MKFSPQATAAIDLMIDAYAKLQGQLAPLDAACDTIIDGLVALRSGTFGAHSNDVIRRLECAHRCTLDFMSAIQGLEILGPASHIVQRELHGMNRAREGDVR